MGIDITKDNKCTFEKDHFKCTKGEMTPQKLVRIPTQCILYNLLKTNHLDFGGGWGTMHISLTGKNKNPGRSF
jgi:hypothetical protein